MEIIIDYAPIKGCNNPNTYGAICVKCNKCGRFENKKESVKMKQLDSGWIPFEGEYALQGKIPEEEQEIIVTDGKTVWCDTFLRDEIGCYLDSGSCLVDSVIAWQPLPKIYKESESDEQRRIIEKCKTDTI
mgnify:CR=1 FL=1